MPIQIFQPRSSTIRYVYCLNLQTYFHLSMSRSFSVPGSSSKSISHIQLHRVYGPLLLSKSHPSASALMWRAHSGRISDQAQTALAISTKLPMAGASNEAPYASVHPFLERPQLWLAPASEVLWHVFSFARHEPSLVSVPILEKSSAC
jgi:hypothetical protein